VNLDADNYCMGLAGLILSTYKKSPPLQTIMHMTSDKTGDGTFGRVIYPRVLFELVGGYDEHLQPYGGEEIHLIFKMMKFLIWRKQHTYFYYVYKALERHDCLHIIKDKMIICNQLDEKFHHYIGAIRNKHGDTLKCISSNLTTREMFKYNMRYLRKTLTDVFYDEFDALTKMNSLHWDKLGFLWDKDSPIKQHNVIFSATLYNYFKNKTFTGFPPRFYFSRFFKCPNLVTTILDANTHRLLNTRELLHIKARNKNNHKEFCSGYTLIKFIRRIAPRGIKYIGRIGLTGYSDAARSYLYMLNHYHNVTFDSPDKPTWDKLQDDTQDETHNNIFKQLYKKSIEYDIIIIHLYPSKWKQFYEKGKTCYGMTAWESTRIPKSWDKHLDQVDRILVPCEWNRMLFQAHTKTPVYVWHHLCHNRRTNIKSTSIIERMNLNKNIFMFFSVGEWVTRKRLELLIKLFKEVFPSRGASHACLVIKTNDAPDIALPENIILINKRIPQNEMTALMERCNCYVSLTAGEGAGMNLLWAAKLEKPIIAPNFGGHLDYISGDFLPYTMVPAKCSRVKWFNGTSQWCLVDEKAVKQRLYNEYLAKHDECLAKHDTNKVLETRTKLKITLNKVCMEFEFFTNE